VMRRPGYGRPGVARPRFGPKTALHTLTIGDCLQSNQIIARFCGADITARHIRALSRPHSTSIETQSDAIRAVYDIILPDSIRRGTSWSRGGVRRQAAILKLTGVVESACGIRLRNGQFGFRESSRCRCLPLRLAERLLAVLKYSNRLISKACRLRASQPVVQASPRSRGTPPRQPSPAMA